MKTLLLTGGSSLLALNWAIAVRDKFNIILGLNKRIIAPSFASSVNLTTQSFEVLKNEISIVKPDFVVNTIALTNVDHCEKNPDLAYSSNVITAKNISLVCHELGISLVHFSTDHLFTGNESYVTEAPSCSPLNIYARTKLLAEAAVSECCPNTLIVRTNFYGWGTTYRQSFTDRILSCLHEGKIFQAFNDVYFTPILIADMVDVVLTLMNLQVKGIFNVVSDLRISKYEFALTVARIFGFNDSVINSVSMASVPSLVSRPKDMSLSNRKVCSLINKNLGTVDEGIDKLKNQLSSTLYQELRNL